MDWNTFTLGEALARNASDRPDALAIIDGPERISYAQLDHRVDALAHGLRDLGIGRGEHVAVWLTNCADWVACWVACARIGAVVVPINTRFKTDEVRYILKQSDARALVMMDRFWNIDFLGMAREMMPGVANMTPGALHADDLPMLRSLIVWKDVQAPGFFSLNEIAGRGEARVAAGATLPEAHAEDPIVIVYTSGTTGHPKGAMHSHILLRNAANMARAERVFADDVLLGHMPFYHVAGCVAQVALSMMAGCTLVPVPHWVADDVLDIIERERVTIFGGIPTHFIDCLDALRKKPRDTTCLKSAWIGGAPVTPEIALAAREALTIEGLQCTYGMTETTACTALSEWDAPLEVLCDNKGKPIGDFELSIRDSQGREMPVNREGELWVRGHIVMLGYYRNPEATAEVMTPDGWFRTGDLALFDEHGYLKTTGRLKEMFIVGGSNAYPAEIERMLQSHPKVKQVVVVGVPDHRLGEVGHAFVQLHDAPEGEEHEEAAAQALIEYCRSHMADYKVPRRICFVDEFPRTPTGKIQRFLLARQARAPAQVTP
ncbi:AMP-binding protein [Caballeronia sp. LZ065]|uniref:class I adenylate-forming enzyme family protein n=1 Tax=Caballeronia sp. LZ065 TaxID=3038571 RepID=UPI0028593AD2|nr:AMP-binding protein [Caballeronia sp. LZ065]MDR5780807.1 AMP-binding protein [Caballeronia sp. LZ065]